MAVYAIGDVQGCYSELQRLVERLAFDPAVDRLWFTGDLVNRGPHSLQTLRFIRSLGSAAVAVLGNHDLHLLAVAHGISRTKHRDTFSDILRASDREELLDWLRRRPLLYREAEFYLIHAGLPPQWTLSEASERAAEAETLLAGPDCIAFCRHMYGDQPDEWSESLEGWDRIRFIVNCFTRLRYCDRNGRIDLKEKGPPGSQPPCLVPWFRHPSRRSEGQGIIVFGHWSTLGLHEGPDVRALDTGCLWGGELTALELGGSGRRVAVPGRRGGYQTAGLS